MTQMQPFEEIYSPIEPANESVKPDGLMTRAEVLGKLVEALPTNELGLPNYIYRADLIPADLYQDHVTEAERVSVLDASSIALDYVEGYPSQQNGTPFWSQLSFEPVQAYMLFTQYLGVTEKEDDTGRLVAPVRTLTATARITGKTEKVLRELSQLYYWPARAKAHDLFMVANFQKMRESRALLVEDAQFLKAKKWAAKAEERLEAIFADEDELYDLKPNQVVAMFKDMMMLQRVAAGLPANGPAAQDENLRNASLQNALKAIAKNAGETAKEVSEDDVSVQNMLDDPEALAALQEMIIKANPK